VTVLNVPESSIFEVVQTVPQDHQAVGEVNAEDIHINVCGESNAHQDELHQEHRIQSKVTRIEH